MTAETTLDLRDGPPGPTPDHDHHRPPRRFDEGAIVGAVLVVVGILWGAERAGWLDLSATAVLALATCAVGVAAVVRSFDGEYPGLITVGIVLAVIAALTAAAPFEGFQGGIGDRTIAPETAADLGTDYELGAGRMVVDLRDLDDLASAQELELNVGFGELIVHVPPGMAVAVEAEAGAGDVVLFGRTSDGVFVHDESRTPGFDQATGRLHIEANVLFGTVEVTDR